MIIRAAAYKQAQAELEGCKAQLEAKEQAVLELKAALKARAGEMSDMSVRVGLAERRLESVGKDNEDKVSRLERRTEQLEAQLKRTERCVCMYGYMHISMYVCLCRYVCMYVCLFVCFQTTSPFLKASMMENRQCLIILYVCVSFQWW